MARNFTDFGSMFCSRRRSHRARYQFYDRPNTATRLPTRSFNSWIPESLRAIRLTAVQYFPLLSVKEYSTEEMIFKGAPKEMACSVGAGATAAMSILRATRASISGALSLKLDSSSFKPCASNFFISNPAQNVVTGVAACQPKRKVVGIAAASSPAAQIVVAPPTSPQANASAIHLL